MYSFSELCFCLCVNLTLLVKAFIMDQPAMVKSELVNTMSLWSSPAQAEITYSLLYSSYHLPVCLFIIFIGIFSDKYGTGIVYATTQAVLSLGQLTFTLGLHLKKESIMLLGRFLIGMGGESLMVLSYIWILLKFKNKNPLIPLSI